ncbi:hypothetical protein [Sinorhizobium meliloti]|nr:hypothetical protein [Sinorhizobium meliloti]
MGPMPDMTGIFYLAIFGLICGAIGGVGGLAWLVYFVVNHVQIV